MSDGSSDLSSHLHRRCERKPYPISWLTRTYVRSGIMTGASVLRACCHDRFGLMPRWPSRPTRAGICIGEIPPRPGPEREISGCRGDEGESSFALRWRPTRHRALVHQVVRPRRIGVWAGQSWTPQSPREQRWRMASRSRARLLGVEGVPRDTGTSGSRRRTMLSG
jgi:hypothetical protein